MRPRTGEHNAVAKFRVAAGGREWHAACYMCGWTGPVSTKRGAEAAAARHNEQAQQ